MGSGRVARLSLPLFFLAFGVTLAELSWWTVFNLRSVSQKGRAQHALLTRDAGLARDLLLAARSEARARGGDEHEAELRRQAQLRPLFYDLDFGPDAQVAPRPEVVAALERTGRAHVRMFVAEGSFFAVMMVAGAALILRALRHEMKIVRQEKNFLAAVTHELKSPLASMRLWVETLLHREVDALSRRRYLGIVLRDVDRLEALVGNVLSAARLEANPSLQVIPALPPLDLAAATQAALDGQQEHARTKGVTLRWVAPPTPVWARVDAAGWSLVVRNLLDNAIKYSPGAAEVHVALACTARDATLVVRDFGVGLAARERRRVFDKFYRVGDEMVRGSAGTGLGLYLVRATLAEHGGRVAVDSAGLGQGATFTVRLPAAPAPEALAAPPNPAETRGRR